MATENLRQTAPWGDKTAPWGDKTAPWETAPWGQRTCGDRELVALLTASGKLDTKALRAIAKQAVGGG